MDRDKLLDKIKNFNLPIINVELSHRIFIHIDQRTRIYAMVNNYIGRDVDVNEVQLQFYNRSDRKWHYKELKTKEEKEMVISFIKLFVQSGEVLNW